MKIFLSYNSADKYYGEALRQRLVEDQHEIVSGGDFELGGEVIQNVLRLMRDSDGFLFILSQESLKSKWQAWEWRNALERTWSRTEKKLVMLILGEVDPPFDLQAACIIRVASDPDIQGSINKVAEVFGMDAPGWDEGDEESVAQLRGSVETIAKEIAKLRLSREDLKEQVKWVLRRIEQVGLNTPDSGEMPTLQGNLARLVKLADRVGKDISADDPNGNPYELVVKAYDELKEDGVRLNVEALRTALANPASRLTDVLRGVASILDSVKLDEEDAMGNGGEK